MDRGLQSYFRDLARADHEVLGREEEKKLAMQVEAGDQKAKAELVEHNLRLVVDVANNYRNLGVEFSDLIQEGNLGLLVATEKFNPELGYKFSTYAYWWIRQRIIRALNKQSRTVRVPSYVSGLKRKIRGITREYKNKEGREPTVGELAERLNLSEERIKRAMRTGRRTKSLDKPLQDSEGAATLAEIVGGEGILSPKQKVEAELAVQKLNRLMEEKLTDRERRVLRLRYGLEDYRPRTLEEIGEVFDLSRERIRQLEGGALEKLRILERARKLARNI